MHDVMPAAHMRTARVESIMVGGLSQSLITGDRAATLGYGVLRVDSGARDMTERDRLRATSGRAEPPHTRTCACGARIASDNADAMCSACRQTQRDRLVRPPRLGPDFFDTPAFHQAREKRHMGAVFRVYRSDPRHIATYGRNGITQELLGSWLGISQPQVNRIERSSEKGLKGPQNFDTLAFYALTLGLPQDILWFELPRQSVQPSREITAPSKTAMASVTPPRDVVPDFGARVDLGANPADFLSSISVETPAPSRIGWTDVANVRATTRAVAMSENLFGGGLSCEAAVGQLQWAGRLLDARATDDVRRSIFEAVGNLSGVVAFSAFDVADYLAADRCFKFALWCADQGGSWALRANTLAEMSRKAAYLGNTDDALSLIEFAQVRSDRVSATAQAMMATIRARLLALTNRHAEASAEVERADAYFAGRDPDADPPWLCYYDEAEHQGSTGRALIPVARASNRLDLAAPRLDAAIRLHNASYPRSRTFSRTRLASLIMAIGDPHEAAPIGRQAVVDAAPLRSQRIVSELHGLARAAEPHERIGEVADLRHTIAALAQSAD